MTSSYTRQPTMSDLWPTELFMDLSSTLHTSETASDCAAVSLFQSSLFSMMDLANDLDSTQALLPWKPPWIHISLHEMSPGDYVLFQLLRYLISFASRLLQLMATWTLISSSEYSSFPPWTLSRRCSTGPWNLLCLTSLPACQSFAPCISSCSAPPP